MTRVQLHSIIALVLCATVACGGGLRDTLPDAGVNVVRAGGSSGSGGASGAGGMSGSGGARIDAPAGPDVPGSMIEPSPDSGEPGPPATDPGCDPGFHKCGDKCVDSRSVATCGVACDPCPTVAGGEATCNGTTCGVKCPAGKKYCPSSENCIGENEPCGGGCPAGKNPCNGLCVAATEKTACGPSCVVCPTSPSGTTTCDGTECKLACNTGFHLCGTECKSNTSVDSCGMSCTPCKPAEGGGASCVNGACQATCPAGTTLCKSTGKCQPPNAACGGECPAGKHDCNGNCVDNGEVNNCGPTSCSPCPVPPNADATCDGRACGFKCKAGHHLCGDKCVPDNSTASCGTQCSPCASTANGVSTCANGACGLRCNDGYHLCGSSCRSNTDADACGASCTKCDAPANARAVCTNGACGFECTTGRKCNGQCIADDVPCGTNCAGGRTLCNGKCYVSNGLPAEVCSNNADDDCDGQVDCSDSNCGNGTACGGGKICQGGSCVTPCSSQNGQTCDGNSCNPGKFDCAGNCVNRQPKCPGQLCQNGNCVAPCSSSGAQCSSNPGANACIRGKLQCNSATNKEECVNDGNNSKCSATQICKSGTCDACGGAGQPCCSGGCSGSNACVGGFCKAPEGSRCSKHADCASNICSTETNTCRPCGGSDQPCCHSVTNRPRCNSPLSCYGEEGGNVGICSCGHSNLACCQDAAGRFCVTFAEPRRLPCQSGFCPNSL